MLNETRFQQQQQGRRYGLRIRVMHIKSIQSRRKIDTLSLEIQTGRQQNYPSQFTTFVAQKRKGIWMQDFYFNNCIDRDSYHFTLIADEEDRSNSVQLQGSKYFSLFTGKHVFTKSEELHFQFGNNASVVICVELSVFQNEDFMVGVQMPELTLSNLKQTPHIPVYNAIQVVRSQKLNCFSCMDELMPGFDNLQLVCSRIKVKNKHRTG